jgi:hypothetical protein
VLSGINCALLAVRSSQFRAMSANVNIETSIRRQSKLCSHNLERLGVLDQPKTFLGMGRCFSDTGRDRFDSFSFGPLLAALFAPTQHLHLGSRSTQALTPLPRGVVPSRQDGSPAESISATVTNPLAFLQSGLLSSAPSAPTPTSNPPPRSSPSCGPTIWSSGRASWTSP